MRAYHDAHYVNPAIVVAAAGTSTTTTSASSRRAHFRPEPGAAVRARASSARRRRATSPASRRRTPSSTTSASAARARARDDPDRYAVFVVDTILGGSWSSRLFQEVREKRGLAYSVYSYTSLYADAGLTAVYVGSRQEAVEEAMRVILDVARATSRRT